MPRRPLSETEFFDAFCDTSHIDVEAMHRGSVRTYDCGSPSPLTMDKVIAEHPEIFFRALRKLQLDEQDALLSFHMLGISQENIGKLFLQKQTNFSQLLRRARLHLGQAVRGEKIKYKKNGDITVWQERRAPHVYRVDPECLGQFRITIGCPGFDHLFSSRSTHISTKLDDPSHPD